MTNYKKYVVGEAYGYSPLYVIYGTINHYMKCVGFNYDFAYATKVHDLDKLIDTKWKLTEHWNEVYIGITKRLRCVEGVYNRSQ